MVLDLAGHIHPGHDVVDTVNRLLDKSPWLKESEVTLKMPKSDLEISEESWELSRLWTLVHRLQVTSEDPTSLAGAVLLLRWTGLEYLIDGRRRINAWQRRGFAVGPHRTLVLQRST